ncbi:MAG: hypothetical protein AAF528_04840 [Cyanobacteria bacterium P01_C01_bin.121]
MPNIFNETKVLRFLSLSLLIFIPQLGCGSESNNLTEYELRSILVEELQSYNQELSSTDIKTILRESFIENGLVNDLETVGGSSEKDPGDESTERSAYEWLAIDPELASLGLNVTDAPSLVASTLLEGSSPPYETDECFNLEQVSIHDLEQLQQEELNAEIALIYTYFGVCSDAEGGVEKRIDFGRDSQGQWLITWIGERNACNRESMPWAAVGELCP